MILKQKILIGAASLVGMGIGSLGLGVAHAQTTNPPPVTQTLTQSSPSSGVDSAESPATAESDGPGGHQDPNGVDVNSGGGHQDPNGTDSQSGGGA